MRTKQIGLRSIAFMVIAVIVFLTGIPAVAVPPAPLPPGVLNPLTIPKYVNQLTSPPPVYRYDVKNTTGEYYTVSVTQFEQQILPTHDALGNPTGFGTTTVWGYGGPVKDALTGAALGYASNAPGPSFEASRGTDFFVTYQNNLTGVSHLFAVDPTLHWADPNGMGMPMMPYNSYPPGYPEAQSPIPIIPHLHGGEVQSTFDGNPDSWFTPDGIHGTAYNTYTTTDANAAVFWYPNDQPGATLWYHDHALGITRINVMSGLAGFYLLRDPADTGQLPSGQYEMPLVIQDRTFQTNGDFYFDSLGLNPMDHPYWLPEFFGNTIMVNGLVWPNMDVGQGWYRLRILDGSNARFYELKFVLPDGTAMRFTQIGSDGGYLQAPVSLNKVTIAPGERIDVLIDFTNIPVGTKILLTNGAKAPYPNGVAPDPNTVGQTMQFTVTANPGGPAPVLPVPLNQYLAGNAFPTLTAPAATNKRTLVLWEVMGMGGPLEILLNGQKWAAAPTETPTLGSTEDWIIVNPTADTHPIHLHLVQFQVVSRQKIDIAKYQAAWLAAQTDPGINNDNMPPWTIDYTPVEVDATPFLKGKAKPAEPNERGWKDTVQVNPGEVTVIRVRWAPIDGAVAYPFDATVGPGYVWHCHILDHEDNEMMRPYIVLP